MLSKFLPRIEFDSYEDFKKNYKVNIPEGFNFAYDIIDGWQMLLQIDSMETDEVFINFTDEGVLCFYIEPERLDRQDFSDVRIMQIYS